MARLIVVCFIAFVCLTSSIRSFDVDDYVAYIDELSRDENFVEQYAQWSLELFSQPDYVYGSKHGKFPCPIPNNTNVATSVHALRPSDVKCVAAMGDSLTAGLGAHALTPVGLLTENRGMIINRVSYVRI
jgi:hypothetical protein